MGNLAGGTKSENGMLVRPALGVECFVGSAVVFESQSAHLKPTGSFPSRRPFCFCWHSRRSLGTRGALFEISLVALCRMISGPSAWGPRTDCLGSTLVRQ